MVVTRCFAGGLDGKESAWKVGPLGSIPGLGRSLGGGDGNALQYSCLENPHGQGSLVGYRPWGCKESNATEQLSIPQHSIMSIKFLLNLSPPKISLRLA